MSPAPTPPTPSGPRAPAADPALHADIVGTGPRLVLAHGFTQTGRVWGSMDDDLSRDHQLVAVDLPGHGESASVSADLDRGGRLLGAAGGRAAYLGYSMGARFCLHLALDRPALVRSLVLISGTPGIEDPAERRQRRLDDEALAEELDPVAGISGTALPVEDFVRRWLAGPLFAGIGPEDDGLEQRLRNTGPGLASSLRLAGTGTQAPLWERLPGLTMPVLIISGALDEKFTALGERMAVAIGPSATRVVIPDAGHAPHLQHPGTVAALIRAYLSATTER